jgi:Tfp pilus assembly protein PilF
MIYDRLGDSLKAKEYLQRALQTNSEFHITYAETARQTLDRMNKRQAEVSAQEAGNAQ